MQLPDELRGLLTMLVIIGRAPHLAAIGMICLHIGDTGEPNGKAYSAIFTAKIRNAAPDGYA